MQFWRHNSQSPFLLSRHVRTRNALRAKVGFWPILLKKSAIRDLAEEIRIIFYILKNFYLNILIYCLFMER